MACKFKFNPDRIVAGLSCLMAEAVGYDLSLIDYDLGDPTSITLSSRDDDELTDLEDFCVAHGVAFERFTAYPSQMGQEPHKVTFRPGMDKPVVTPISESDIDAAEQEAIARDCQDQEARRIADAKASWL